MYKKSNFPAKVINNPLPCFSPSRYHEKQLCQHENLSCSVLIFS